MATESDLDQTAWVIAGPAGEKPTAAEIQRLRGEFFARIGLDPHKADMTVFDGDRFIPDWRNSKLGSTEFVSELARQVAALRSDPEAYSAPGANKEIIHNRALSRGRTMHLTYDYEGGWLVINGRPFDIDAYVRGEIELPELPTRGRCPSLLAP